MDRVADHLKVAIMVAPGNLDLITHSLQSFKVKSTDNRMDNGPPQDKLGLFY